MKKESAEQNKINFNFKIDTQLKVVYNESLSDEQSNVKVLYGRFQSANEKFIELKYPNSDDTFYININSIVLLGEVKSK